MDNPASPIDTYIAGFPTEVQAVLQQVRAVIREEAPEATESISYGIPTFTWHGKLIYFAGFAKHISVYPAPRGYDEFRDELAAYPGGKGTVQFALDKPIPFDLIRRIVRFRMTDNLAREAARKSKKKKA